MSEQSVRQVVSEAERNRATLHAVEGLAVVMLCSSKPIIRKQAVIMLKETRNLFTILNVPKVATTRRLFSTSSLCACSNVPWFVGSSASLGVFLS